MIDTSILRLAVESAHHGIYVTDPNGVVEYANAAFFRLTGYAADQIVGSPISILSSGSMPDSYYDRLWSTIKQGSRWEEEITNRRKDGTLYHAFQIIAPIVDETGTVRHFVGIQHDVTEERRIRGELAQAVLEFEAIFSNTQDAMFLVDVSAAGDEFRYRKLSTTHERLTGLTTDRVRGRTPVEVFGPEQGETLTAYYRRCVETQRSVRYEERLTLPVGEHVWQTILSPIVSDDRVVQVVGSARDITEEKNLAENLRVLSEVDTLTGVLNRRKIGEELQRELSRAQRHGNALSVLMTDIDHFKSINDEFGHEVGDQALCCVAQTIQSTLRPTDRVGRWGGEEFVVILPETDHPGARAAAERLRSAVEQAEGPEGRHITVSVGVASLGPRRSDNPRGLSHSVDSLLRIADEEMYRAKDLGRNRVHG